MQGCAVRLGKWPPVGGEFAALTLQPLLLQLQRQQRVTSGNVGRNIMVMTNKTSSGAALAGAVQVVAPASGTAGLGALAHLAGLPLAVQTALWGMAGLVGVATAVNSAIARGRRQQTSARQQRLSVDDRDHLVATRSRIRDQLADPITSASRRRNLERTYRQLSIDTETQSD